jgi:hypothetical protein
VRTATANAAVDATAAATHAHLLSDLDIAHPLSVDVLLADALSSWLRCSAQSYRLHQPGGKLDHSLPPAMVRSMTGNKHADAAISVDYRDCGGERSGGT